MLGTQGHLLCFLSEKLLTETQIGIKTPTSSNTTKTSSHADQNNKDNQDPQEGVACMLVHLAQMEQLELCPHGNSFPKQSFYSLFLKKIIIL